jgi:NADH-quinone oxidoreductase subunit G
MTDLRVLAALADGLGKPLGIRTAKQALAEIVELGTWDAPAAKAKATRKVAARKASSGPATVTRTIAGPDDGSIPVKLSTWRQLIDGGRGQDGEEFMAATARDSVARVSPALAAQLGVANGDEVSIDCNAGWYTLPVVITPGMAEGTVWVPTNSPGTPLGELGVVFGDDVALSVGGEE